MLLLIPYKLMKAQTHARTIAYSGMFFLLLVKKILDERSDERRKKKQQLLSNFF